MRTRWEGSRLQAKRSLRMKPVWPALWSWTSSLQNWEKSVSVCLSAPVLGVLSWQSGQNKTIMMTLANTVEHLQCARHYFRKCKEIPGLLWPSSGKDPMLPMQGAQVWFLVRELRSHKPHGGVKKNKPRNSCYDGVHILVNVLHDNMYAISIYLSIRLS